jgi:hypothetical protein
MPRRQSSDQLLGCNRSIVVDYPSPILFNADGNHPFGVVT